MTAHKTVRGVVFIKSFPMPMEDKHTSRRMFLVCMPLTTFRVPSAHHRSIEGCRFPRQLMTASAPSMASPISFSAESFATSILLIVSDIVTSTSSVFVFSVGSSTSTSRPLSVPSLLFSTDRAMGMMLQDRDGSRRASVITNFPTSPMPPLVAYMTATVFVVVVVVVAVCVVWYRWCSRRGQDQETNWCWSLNSNWMKLVEVEIVERPPKVISPHRLP
mmetsp:Transcript_16295/g.19314  ORF Transcript_16295/g.19314 Transcript_16295/m.19314 type:complete len:218 (-) Transcript_16295:297-950(-)